MMAGRVCQGVPCITYPYLSLFFLSARGKPWWQKAGGLTTPLFFLWVFEGLTLIQKIFPSEMTFEESIDEFQKPRFGILWAMKIAKRTPDTQFYPVILRILGFQIASPIVGTYIMPGSLTSLPPKPDRNPTATKIHELRTLANYIAVPFLHLKPWIYALCVSLHQHYMDDLLIRNVAQSIWTKIYSIIQRCPESYMTHTHTVMPKVSGLLPGWLTVAKKLTCGY